MHAGAMMHCKLCYKYDLLSEYAANSVASCKCYHCHWILLEAVFKLGPHKEILWRTWSLVWNVLSIQPVSISLAGLWSQIYCHEESGCCYFKVNQTTWFFFLKIIFFFTTIIIMLLLCHLFSLLLLNPWSGYTHIGKGINYSVIYLGHLFELRYDDMH